MSERYLFPDYSDEASKESPKEDDDFLEECSEDDARIEKLLDEQETEKRNEYMGDFKPFNWGSNNNNNNTSQQKPWETNQNNGNSIWGSGSSNNSKPAWGSWGSAGSGSGGSSWGNNSSQQQPLSTEKIVSVGELRKRAIIIDLLDCLYESWDANNKPDLLPRGIFDLKPKFQVWEKLTIFSPTKIYIIFPPKELIPSFGNIDALYVTLEYVAQSISAYLRIPRGDCMVLSQMVQGSPKEKILLSAIKDWRTSGGPNTGRPEEMIYIGAHSGMYDLSSRDLEAAKSCGINFMNVYNLVQSRYILE